MINLLFPQFAFFQLASPEFMCSVRLYTLDLESELSPECCHNDCVVS